MPHRSIHDLLETVDGKYWIATGDGLVLFNPQGVARRWRGFESNTRADDESLMFRVFRPDDAKGGTSVWSVSQLLKDTAGTLWATTSLGVYNIQKTDQQWKLQRIDKEEWHNKGKEFQVLLQDKSGALWFAGLGIYRVLPNGKVQVVSSKVIISLFQDKAGNIWAGTAGEGEAPTCTMTSARVCRAWQS